MKKAALLKILPSPTVAGKETKQKTIFQMWRSKDTKKKASTSKSSDQSIAEVVLDSDDENNDKQLLQTVSFLEKNQSRVLSEIHNKPTNSRSENEDMSDMELLKASEIIETNSKKAGINCWPDTDQDEDDFDDMELLKVSETIEKNSNITQRAKFNFQPRSDKNSNDTDDLNDIDLLKASETFDTLQTTNTEASVVTCGINDEDVG